MVYYTNLKAAKTPKNMQKKTRENISRVKPMILGKIKKPAFIPA